MLKTVKPRTRKSRPQKSPQSSATIAATLQQLQRQRAIVLKSRNMQANRLQAIIAADVFGYRATMTDADRKKLFKDAAAFIRDVDAIAEDHPYKKIIQTTLVGIDAFNMQKADLEKRMTDLAKSLPVAEWVNEPEQRGFGILFLAIVVGECGDLSNYQKPGQLWRRMCCAPWTHGNKTQMGATWRSGKSGKLPAEEWEKYGYSPRRRSIAFLIGDGLVKLNQEGPYRTRYDAMKARQKGLHPEYSDMRCHLHGMLLATKLLLKNLWMAWNPSMIKEDAELRTLWF